MGEPAEQLDTGNIPANTLITVNGKQYDLTKAVPFNLGQLCELEDKGITQQTFQEWANGNVKVSHVRALLTSLLKRIDPGITQEAIDSIEMGAELTDALTATFMKFAPGGGAGTSPSS